MRSTHHLNASRESSRCDVCNKARAIRCVGPCALRDVAAQIRKAMERDREHVDHA